MCQILSSNDHSIHQTPNCTSIGTFSISWISSSLLGHCEVDNLKWATSGVLTGTFSMLNLCNTFSIEESWNKYRNDYLLSLQSSISNIFLGAPKFFIAKFLLNKPFNLLISVVIFASISMSYTYSNKKINEQSSRLFT